MSFGLNFEDEGAIRCGYASVLVIDIDDSQKKSAMLCYSTYHYPLVMLIRVKPCFLGKVEGVSRGIAVISLSTINVKFVSERRRHSILDFYE